MSFLCKKMNVGITYQYFITSELNFAFQSLVFIAFKFWPILLICSHEAVRVGEQGINSVFHSE